MFEEYDPAKIQDEHAREVVQKVLNLLEKTFVQVDKLREENQKLRDELALLKGEQPKPKILPNNPTGSFSSEKERKARTQKGPKSKRKAINSNLTIHQMQKLTLERSTLPEDAEFKGYRSVIVRDVIFGAFNTRFKKERFYSPSTQQSYEAALPPGYSGQFGPNLKSLTFALYFSANMSEDKIQELFTHVGVEIAIGTISNWLCLKDVQTDTIFRGEYQEVYEAGIASSPWQHLDTTVTRVEGNNQNCHILTNPLYTFYTTLPQRDRLSALQALRGGAGAARVFRMDKNAVEIARRMGGYKNWQTKMGEVFPTDRAMDEGEVDQLLSDSDNFASLAGYKRKWIKDSLAIAAYYAHDPPLTAVKNKSNEVEEVLANKTKPPTVVKLLVCDDAPQFQMLTEEVALCWIHDVRYYKKLNARVAAHKTLVADFLQEYWDYYFELSAYRTNPNEAERQRLSQSFNELFSRKTGYSGLDERIAITYAKKSGLLMVLKHPEIPLHNNPAELGARQRVRKRDVSLHARTERGVGCWDVFQTLVESCKKLGVNFYKYVLDRVCGEGHIVRLDKLIEEKARSLELGKSWENARPRPEWHKLEMRAWLR